MQAFGARVRRTGYDRFVVSTTERYKGRSYTVEGDYSSASYFFAIAAICGGRVTVKNLLPGFRAGRPEVPRRARGHGVHGVRTGTDAVTVERSRDLHGITFDMSTSPDTVQTLCMVAAVAKTPTTITGISHLKFKESDRINGTAERLRALGGAGGCGQRFHHHPPGPAAWRHHRPGKRPPHGNEFCRARSRHRGDHDHGCRVCEQVVPGVLGDAETGRSTGMKTDRILRFPGYRERPRSGRSLQSAPASPSLTRTP